MSINLTTEQEKFIQSKIEAGKYRSTQEVLEIALQLLDEYDRAEAEWNGEVGEKIDAALAVSEQTAPVDGNAFVEQVLDRFKRSRQA